MSVTLREEDQVTLPPYDEVQIADFQISDTSATINVDVFAGGKSQARVTLLITNDQCQRLRLNKNAQNATDVIDVATVRIEGALNRIFDVEAQDAGLVESTNLLEALGISDGWLPSGTQQANVVKTRKKDVGLPADEVVEPSQTTPVQRQQSKS